MFLSRLNLFWKIHRPVFVASASTFGENDPKTGLTMATFTVGECASMSPSCWSSHPLLLSRSLIWFICKKTSRTDVLWTHRLCYLTAVMWNVIRDDLLSARPWSRARLHKCTRSVESLHLCYQRWGSMVSSLSAMLYSPSPWLLLRSRVLLALHFIKSANLRKRPCHFCVPFLQQQQHIAHLRRPN